MGFWIEGLHESKYFADVLLGATFCVVGLVYCFIVDFLTPSSKGGRVVSDEQLDDVELVAMLETGTLPEGVYFDLLKGISGMPTSMGTFTVLVHEAKTEKEAMRVTYRVDDDFSKSGNNNGTGNPTHVDVNCSEENNNSGSATGKALQVGGILLAGSTAVAFVLFGVMSQRRGRLPWLADHKKGGPSGREPAVRSVE